MNFRFLCKKHGIDLDGFPLWTLTSSDPDIFIISLKGFTCNGGLHVLETMCNEEDHWEVIEVDDDGKSLG